MYATQQLREEHDGILLMLDILDNMADRLAHGEAVKTAHLAAVLDFLRTFADKCHHGKEEELLFPALTAVGLPSEGGPIGAMLHEHTEGRGYIRGMAEALERLQTGENAEVAFADQAHNYVHLLRAHIEKENQVLFVIAEHHLDADAHARLATAFDRVEQERIGPGVHEQYHALLHTLREIYLPKAA